MNAIVLKLTVTVKLYDRIVYMYVGIVIVASAITQSNAPGTTFMTDSMTHPSRPKVELPGGGGEGVMTAAAASVEFASDEDILFLPLS